MAKKRSTSRDTKPLDENIVTTPVVITSSMATQPLYRVKCVYPTRLIVEAGVPSGTRYEFQPGETKPVKAEDYQFLLSKERKNAGCCGATPGVVRLFEEA